MKHRIELIVSPLLYSHRVLTGAHTAVAVDILRATTTICAAFQSGAEEVVPLLSLEELEPYRRQGYQSAAERNGQRVGNAEWGNSPSDYLAHDLHGVRLAFSSTNGTVAIHTATEAEQVLIGAFSNLSRLSRHLSEHPSDVVILCSGWKNDISLEDTLFGGALIDRLCASGIYEPVNDAAAMATSLWHEAKDKLYDYCRHATHVLRLQRLGYDPDIRLALRSDTCPVLPCRKGQQPIRLLS